MSSRVARKLVVPADRVLDDAQAILNRSVVQVDDVAVFRKSLLYCESEVFGCGLLSRNGHVTARPRKRFSTARCAQRADCRTASQEVSSVPHRSPTLKICHILATLLSAGQKKLRYSVAKFVEISSESQKGFEDAIQIGIIKTADTVHNIRSAWIKEQEVVVENGKVSRFRVIMKVGFVVD